MTIIVSVIAGNGEKKISKGKQMVKNLQIIVEPCQIEYRTSEDITVDVKLFNATEEDLFIEGPLSIEGLKIRFYISNADGVPVYSSPAVKIELKRSYYREFLVPPMHFIGARFKIPVNTQDDVALTPGNYVIRAVYQSASSSKKGKTVEGIFESDSATIIIKAK